MMEQALFRINSPKIPYSLCVTAISCLGVNGNNEDDGAGSVPNEQPKVHFGDR
jgi:hypothetical protein